jgi:hypothetical protein
MDVYKIFIIYRVIKNKIHRHFLNQIKLVQLISISTFNPNPNIKIKIIRLIYLMQIKLFRT